MEYTTGCLDAFDRIDSLVKQRRPQMVVSVVGNRYDLAIMSNNFIFYFFNNEIPDRDYIRNTTLLFKDYKLEESVYL